MLLRCMLLVCGCTFAHFVAIIYDYAKMNCKCAWHTIICFVKYYGYSFSLVTTVIVEEYKSFIMRVPEFIKMASFKVLLVENQTLEGFWTKLKNKTYSSSNFEMDYKYAKVYCNIFSSKLRNVVEPLYRESEEEEMNSLLHLPNVWNVSWRKYWHKTSHYTGGIFNWLSTPKHITRGDSHQLRSDQERQPGFTEHKF